MALVKFGNDDSHLMVDSWAVAVYEMGREYGGPEEGGWYYDTRELVAVATADSEDAATALVLELEQGAYKTTGDRFSVNYGRRGDVEYHMYIHEPGDEIIYNDPAVRPHYE